VVRATKLPWIVALAAPALSCSLIVQFHDQPDAGPGGGGEAGAIEDAGSGDAAMDATMDVSPQMDSGPDLVVMDDVVEEVPLVPCLGKQNGWYCGNNGLDELLPDADLVYCDGGGIGSITACDAGCLHVVDPFPDSCNPCGGRVNGDYCGKQLAGFNPDNSDILIGCTGGQVSLQDACAAGCGPNGSMSACY
jgi:hypothetical protein